MTSKIYRTWCERIEAPVMEASHIRQFKDAIALPVLTGQEPNGRRTALTDNERFELYEMFNSRVRSDGGPKVTEAQAEQGRNWLDRYWKKIRMPNVNYRTIQCFRFVDVAICNERTMPFALPVYECDWGDEFARLRYVPAPWQTNMPDSTEFWWVYATNFQKEPAA